MFEFFHHITMIVCICSISFCSCFLWLCVDDVLIGIHICRASHLGILYLGSLVVLFVYSILYGRTAMEAKWLGAITSAAVIILGSLPVTMVAC